MTELAVQSLMDKSSLTRKNAIKLLSKLITTHPFGVMHGSRLVLTEWQQRLDAVQAEIDSITPKVSESQLAGNQTLIDPSMLDAPSDDEMEDPQDEEEENSNNIVGRTVEAKSNTEVDPEMISKLKLTQKYHDEAIEFIKQIHTAVGNVEALLFSKIKTETIDAMDFFVLADTFGIEPARDCIRKMIHLVWAKGNNDDGQAIQSHLISCYQSIFLETPLGMAPSDANLLIARNLISLTYGATLAELASLEKLLGLAMEGEAPLISPGVISKLWQIYGFQQRAISKTLRRGAVIVLGMLARSDSSVIGPSGMEMLLKIGLGPEGHGDLSLAKFSCVALQRTASENEWRKISSKGSIPIRLTISSEVIQKLAELIMMPVRPDDTAEWFGVAEQAINAVYELCQDPDVVFTKLIAIKTKQVFSPERPASTATSDSELSQLLFMVGHVAIKTVVHLERCESLFKRTRIEVEKANALNRSSTDKSSEQQQDDMEMIGGGTTEDDFTGAIAYIKERELFYGKASLLAKFGPLVKDLCKSAVKLKMNETVSIAATLCLSKFMCVSSIFCEDNLPILMTLLGNSKSPIIRSNCVLAMGDIAVCFNHVLDDNTEGLYQRLHDDNSTVQRTCLMTLTFLILAGQVKVKGQLGEMAKCLEDKDKRISDLARMFFTELSTKDNAIYNSFIDVLSVLSADQELEEAVLRRILKFLVAFIDKDKHVKQLSDRLSSRLKRSETEKSWRDTAFVLGILPHKNDDIAAALNEGYKYATIQVE